MVNISRPHAVLQLLGLPVSLLGATAGVFGVIDLWTVMVIAGLGTTFDILVSAHGRRTADHDF